MSPLINTHRIWALTILLFFVSVCGLAADTYTNPIIHADYSDPDVIRVGDDFYLTASSFNCVPGLPILHSKDLLNWRIIGHALPQHRMSADGRRLLDDGKTLFDGRAHHPTIEGPKLYKRNGYYYIFAPAGGVTSGWQTVLRSKSIYGSYEDRVVMDQAKPKSTGRIRARGWNSNRANRGSFTSRIAARTAASCIYNQCAGSMIGP